MIAKPENKMQKILDSFELFAKNFIYITDNEGQSVKLVLNDAQLEIDKLMQKNRFIKIMKARQSGASTLILAKSLHRALTNPNENILIVSYKGDSKDALFSLLKGMNDNIPRKQFPNIFPTVKRDNRGELLFSNGSKISSVTAGSKSVGRGSTYSYIHLSEFAFYQSQEKQLLSIEQSLAKGSHSQLTIESTSNGAGNFDFKLSMQSVNGKSKYVPYFISFTHKLYLKQFDHDIKEAIEWVKATGNGKMITQKDLDDTEKILFDNGATLKILAWRRWKLADTELSSFQQEYPSSVMESFVSSSYAVFDASKIIARLANAIDPMDKSDVCIELPEQLHKYVGRGLDIFHLPKSGKYYFGVDVASGGGGDNSTITAFNEDNEQVLSFYSNKIPIYIFSQIVYDLGMFYNYAFVAVERNSYGIVVLQKMREEMDIPYMNLAKMKVFDQRGKRRNQLGFLTTESTKQLMIQTLKQQIEQGLILIECKKTLSELQFFQESQSGKLGNKAGNGNTDDLVISTGIALWGKNLGKNYVD